jgi:hypothetical protein
MCGLLLILNMLIIAQGSERNVYLTYGGLSGFVLLWAGDRTMKARIGDILLFGIGSLILGLLLLTATAVSIGNYQYFHGALEGLGALGLFAAGALALGLRNEFLDWLDGWEYEQDLRERRREPVDPLFEMPVQLWVTSWIWIWGGAFFVTLGVARAVVLIRIVAGLARFDEVRFAILFMMLLLVAFLASYLILAGFQLRYAVPRDTVLNAVVAFIGAALSSFVAYQVSDRSSSSIAFHIHWIFAACLLVTGITAVLSREEYFDWRKDVEFERKRRK